MAYFCWLLTTVQAQILAIFFLHEKKVFDVSFEKKNKIVLLSCFWQIGDSNSIPLVKQHEIFRKCIETNFARSQTCLSRPLNSYGVKLKKWGGANFPPSFQNKV